MTTKNFNVKNGLTTGNILLDAASGNITSTNANLGNLAIANYFSGNGSLLTGITGANVTGQVGNALVAGTVYTNAQPNITSVGTLSSLAVTANVTAGNIKSDNLLYANGAPYVFTTSAAGSNTQVQFNDGTSFAGSAGFTFDKTTNALSVTGNISGGNISGTLVTGTLATAAQPNITSVGTLTSLEVTGNVTAGNIVTSGSGGNISGVNYVIANLFQGNGSLLTSITGANVTGQVGNALVAGTVYTNAQPNITSVGTLTDLDVSGNAIITGNLVVSGTTSYVNVDTFRVEDPIIELGGGANGAALTTDDGKDRGTLLHYYTDEVVDAFMGWDNSNLEFAFGSNVSLTSEVVTFNSFGNVRASYFLGNGSQLTSLSGSSVTGQVGNALVAGTVYTNAQPNITSVGTLTSLEVTGNITAGNFVTSGSGGNISGVNYVIANFFQGNGSTLSSITGANVDGQVGNALVASTVYTNAQPNITSVGTLSSLVVGNATSNVTITTGSGNGFMAATGNITAPYFIGNVVGNISGTITVPGNNTAVLFNEVGNAGASDNFTFNYASNTLTVTGNLVVSNANLGNATTSNYFIGDGSLLDNISGANVDGTVANATAAVTAGTVTASAQPNITSVGTLTSVSVTGNVSSGNTSVSGGLLSGRANVSVTTNTVIDQFPPSAYRSAKYHISAKGTDGYQSAEVLLVQDGTDAYITIYGSICSNNTADIVDFSSNIDGVSGNVRLYATTASSSTTVNLVPIYIKD